MALPISLCAPSLLFLILGVISTIMLLFHKVNIVSLLIQILLIAVWTFLLNFLCKDGFTVVAWILLLIPFIFLILSFYLGFVVAGKVSQYIKDKEI